MTECVATEQNSFDLAFHRQLVTWLTDARADKARIVISHLVAGLAAEAINAQSSTDEFPNQQETVEKALEAIRRYKTFLAVLDELRAEKEFRMTDLKVKIL